MTCFVTEYNINRPLVRPVVGVRGKRAAKPAERQSRSLAPLVAQAVVSRSGILSGGLAVVWRASTRHEQQFGSGMARFGSDLQIPADGAYCRRRQDRKATDAGFAPWPSHQPLVETEIGEREQRGILRLQRGAQSQPAGGAQSGMVPNGEQSPSEFCRRVRLVRIGGAGRDIIFRWLSEIGAVLPRAGKVPRLSRSGSGPVGERLDVDNLTPDGRCRLTRETLQCERGEVVGTNRVNRAFASNDLGKQRENSDNIVVGPAGEFLQGATRLKPLSEPCEVEFDQSFQAEPSNNPSRLPRRPGVDCPQFLGQQLDRLGHRHGLRDVSRSASIALVPAVFFGGQTVRSPQFFVSLGQLRQPVGQLHYPSSIAVLHGGCPKTHALGNIGTILVRDAEGVEDVTNSLFLRDILQSRLPESNRKPPVYKTERGLSGIVLFLRSFLRAWAGLPTWISYINPLGDRLKYCIEPAQGCHPRRLLSRLAHRLSITERGQS